MTTTINVGPSGHKVRITTIDKADGNVEGSKDRKTIEVIEPGSPIKTVYAHQTRSILIEEVTPADEQPAENESTES